MYVRLHVNTRYYCQILMKLRFSQHFFEKNTQADGQTDRPKNSKFCQHCVFTCFVQMSKQTMISLHSIKVVRFINEECVYCAVRTRSLSVIQINLSI
jgi:hypothetical protein